MAKAKMNQPQKVMIDGIEASHVLSIEVNTEVREYGPFYGDTAVYYAPSNTTARVLFNDGMELQFNVQGMETDKENTVYFYGPLRKLFPALFKDDPEPWQVDYLAALNRPSLDRFKLKKDDPIFDTLIARYYKKGWHCKT
jgi:hypothetical protein